MQNNKILNTQIQSETEEEVIEFIRGIISTQKKFIHIASLNPEILVMAYKNRKVREVIQEAQIKIVDGIGVVLAGKILDVDVGERLTGVDLMEKIIEFSDILLLRILIIGGKPGVASHLAKNLHTKYRGKFIGIEGIKDKYNIQSDEETNVFKLISEFQPHVLFLALGPPEQELWIYDHRKNLKGIICMGVGGAVDFLSGNVRRAPKVIRRIGFEWLFRLIIEPWRWKRQLNLIYFLGLVIRQRLKK